MRQLLNIYSRPYFTYIQSINNIEYYYINWNGGGGGGGHITRTN